VSFAKRIPPVAARPRVAGHTEAKEIGLMSSKNRMVFIE